MKHLTILFAFIFLITACDFNNGTTSTEECVEDTLLIQDLETDLQIVKDESVIVARRPKQTQVTPTGEDQLETQIQDYYLSSELTQPPLFPGAEKANSLRRQRKLSDNLLSSWVAKNLKTPIDTNKVDQVLVIFEVTTAGKIENVEVSEHANTEWAKEAVRVFYQMNEDGLTWLPGKLDTTLVRTKMSHLVVWN